MLAAGDLDGDGRTDLVLRMRYGIDVFLQRDGTFADRKFIELPWPPGSTWPTSTATAPPR